MHLEKNIFLFMAGHTKKKNKKKDNNHNNNT